MTDKVLVPALDLRTDALTRPTPAMWKAMQTHEPDWATFGEDSAVRAVERAGAEILGKDAALFVPTGALGNLLALLTHTRTGDWLIADPTTHVIRSEHRAFEAVAALRWLSIVGERGHISEDQVTEGILTLREQGVRQGLVWTENTHNWAGGTVQTVEQATAVARTAHELGFRVHVDGARLFNAGAALGVPASALVSEADSVMVNLNKGLGAPYGALLSGTSDFVEIARDRLHQLGAGSTHQIGILASAAFVALATMQERMSLDNHTARYLGELLEDISGLELMVGRVESNVVLVRAADGRSARSVVEALRLRGIGAFAARDDVVRFVTHHHVEKRHADRVAREVARVVGGRGHY